MNIWIVKKLVSIVCLKYWMCWMSIVGFVKIMCVNIMLSGVFLMVRLRWKLMCRNLRIRFGSGKLRNLLILKCVFGFVWVLKIYIRFWVVMLCKIWVV